MGGRGNTQPLRGKGESMLMSKYVARIKNTRRRVELRSDVRK